MDEKYIKDILDKNNVEQSENLSKALATILDRASKDRDFVNAVQGKLNTDSLLSRRSKGIR